MSTKDNLDPTSAVRLPVQTDIPTAKDILYMTAESRRSKKRIELLWQPEGRLNPVVLVTQFEERSKKSSWMLYDGLATDSAVVWSGNDPEPGKIVQALRDWYMVSRLSDGWEKQALKTTTQLPSSSPTAQPAIPPVSAAPVAFYQLMPYPAGYLAQPAAPSYPAHSAWLPGYAQPAATFSPEHAAQLWASQDNYLSAGIALPPPELLGNRATMPAGLMLGDVLVAAGIIPTRSLQAALTIQGTAHSERRKIGEILVNSGAVSYNVLKAAIQLQEMARSGTISFNQMMELLARVHTTGTTLDAVRGQSAAAAAAALSAAAEDASPATKELHLADKEAQVTSEDQKKLKDVMDLLRLLDLDNEAGTRKAIQVLDLFKQADVVSEGTLNAIVTSTKSVADTVRTLLVKEVVSPLTFRTALQCQTLISLNRLPVAQAIIAIGYCDRGRVELQDAIAAMNWSIPVDDI